LVVFLPYYDSGDGWLVLVPRYRKQLGQAQSALNELESLYKARGKMVHSANRIAQGLKLIVKERKEACEVRAGEPQGLKLR
jgi:hypothetical protein